MRVEGKTSQADRGHVHIPDSVRYIYKYFAKQCGCASSCVGTWLHVFIAGMSYCCIDGYNAPPEGAASDKSVVVPVELTRRALYVSKWRSGVCRIHFNMYTTYHCGNSTSHVVDEFQRVELNTSPTRKVPSVQCGSSCTSSLARFLAISPQQQRHSDNEILSIETTTGNHSSLPHPCPYPSGPTLDKSVVVVGSNRGEKCEKPQRRSPVDHSDITADGQSSRDD